MGYGEKLLELIDTDSNKLPSVEALLACLPNDAEEVVCSSRKRGDNSKWEYFYVIDGSKGNTREDLPSALLSAIDRYWWEIFIDDDKTTLPFRGWLKGIK